MVSPEDVIGAVTWAGKVVSEDGAFNPVDGDIPRTGKPKDFSPVRISVSMFWSRC